MASRTHTRIRLAWSCTDYRHHEHRYRWTASVCALWQQPGVRLLCMSWAMFALFMVVDRAGVAMGWWPSW